ncbi:hypothetical protein [Fuerstiella marisgermanici]|uniref:Uncharacterized protein n=1 Tax=Fuerstiella marisgermanici TaxID=1891926 RepID=A0A1P8WQ52_9PLAN|nr:hypothetical protein [Fuerstiella marisgermanici]APZ96183.1 hypothetical protein Fuma_05851 [Fuerstiella marisgermanici]
MMIETLWTHVVGYGMVIAMMSGIWKSNARRWTRLARVYSAAGPSDCDASNCVSKGMQTVILTGRDIGWNSYKGIATVNVTSEGILFQLMFPFCTFHPPLLIPFRDIQVVPRQWYLFGKTFQLTLARVKDVQIIVHSELIDWIARQTSQLAVEITPEERITHSDRPRTPEVIH